MNKSRDNTENELQLKVMRKITMRPDIGISAIHWQEIIGKKAKKNFKKLDLIKI